MSVPVSSLTRGRADQQLGAASGLWEYLARVPDPRSRRGRRQPLVSILAILVCALASAGHDSLTAAAEWAARADQRLLATLGVWRDALTGRYLSPSEAAIRRSLARVDPAALEQQVADYLRQRDAKAQPGPAPAAPPDWCRPAAAALVRRPVEREQRRALARLARLAGAPGRARLAAGVAIDGKRLAGARRGDGGRVHLLSATSHGRGIVLAQRRIHDKTNEIPELQPLTAGLDLTGTVVTTDALHTQRETARCLVEDRHAHYLMIIKENQPHLLAAAQAALDGPDADFADTSYTETGRGHGRTEQRSIRTAPATGTDFPYAAQFLRIIRRTGGLDGVTTSKEVVHAVTSLPPDAAGPAELAAHVRNHWTCENKTHYVRDVTFGEDKSQTRTGNAPQNLAAIRNLVIGTYRAAGYANIAHARRDHAADPNLTLNLFFGPHLTQSKPDRSPT